MPTLRQNTATTTLVAKETPAPALASLLPLSKLGGEPVRGDENAAPSWHTGSGPGPSIGAGRPARMLNFSQRAVNRQAKAEVGGDIGEALAAEQDQARRREPDTPPLRNREATVASKGAMTKAFRGELVALEENVNGG